MLMTFMLVMAAVALLTAGTRGQDGQSGSEAPDYSLPSFEDEEQEPVRGQGGAGEDAGETGEEDNQDEDPDGDAGEEDWRAQFEAERRRADNLERVLGRQSAEVGAVRQGMVPAQQPQQSPIREYLRREIAAGFQEGLGREMPLEQATGIIADRIGAAVDNVLQAAGQHLEGRIGGDREAEAAFFEEHQELTANKGVKRIFTNTLSGLRRMYPQASMGQLREEALRQTVATMSDLGYEFDRKAERTKQTEQVRKVKAPRSRGARTSGPSGGRFNQDRFNQTIRQQSEKRRADRFGV